MVMSLMRPMLMPSIDGSSCAVMPMGSDMTLVV
jgi:hypothetical protein